MGAMSIRQTERLEMFYDELKQIHKDYFPDWRFSQLIRNIEIWLYQEKKINDIFYLEEIPMMNFIREFAEKFK